MPSLRSANKFWELTFTGVGYVIVEGDVGKKGRSKKFKWSSNYHANVIGAKAAEKMLAKGYQLVSGQLEPPAPKRPLR